MYGPKFQSQIYPDSVIYIRGDDAYLMERAAGLAAPQKWTREHMLRRLHNFREHNDLSLFELANTRADLGHPKAAPSKFPVFRFF